MRAPVETRAPYGLIAWAVISLILSLAVYAAPLRIAGGPDLMPMLPLITLFVWSTIRPRFIPPIVVFVVGLLNDVLSGSPMGVWALSYLAALTITRSRDDEGPNREIGPMWIRFLVTLIIATVVAWGTGSLAIGEIAAIRPILIEAVASGLMFPLIAMIAVRRRAPRGF